jgi:hypothetical protein
VQASTERINSHLSRIVLSYACHLIAFFWNAVARTARCDSLADDVARKFLAVFVSALKATFLHMCYLQRAIMVQSDRKDCMRKIRIISRATFLAVLICLADVSRWHGCKTMQQGLSRKEGDKKTGTSQSI